MRFIKNFARFDNLSSAFKVTETTVQSRMGTEDDTDTSDNVGFGASPSPFGTSPSPFDTTPEIIGSYSDRPPF
jgi:hypothetical protein